jgi:hypothetical protein
MKQCYFAILLSLSACSSLNPFWDIYPSPTPKTFDGRATKQFGKCTESSSMYSPTGRTGSCNFGFGLATEKSPMVIFAELDTELHKAVVSVEQLHYLSRNLRPRTNKIQAYQLYIVSILPAVYAAVPVTAMAFQQCKYGGGCFTYRHTSYLGGGDGLSSVSVFYDSMPNAAPGTVFFSPTLMEGSLIANDIGKTYRVSNGSNSIEFFAQDGFWQLRYEK